MFSRLKTPGIPRGLLLWKIGRESGGMAEGDRYQRGIHDHRNEVWVGLWRWLFLIPHDTGLNTEARNEQWRGFLYQRWFFTD
jgi:hypothetical protein